MKISWRSIVHTKSERMRQRKGQTSRVTRMNSHLSNSFRDRQSGSEASLRRTDGQTVHFSITQPPVMTITHTSNHSSCHMCMVTGSQVTGVLLQFVRHAGCSKHMAGTRNLQTLLNHAKMARPRDIQHCQVAVVDFWDLCVKNAMSFQRAN